jgi:hypothetical protein
MGQNQNIEIRFFNHRTVDQKGQRKIKMIVVDHLNSSQLFGNDDSKTLFESKLEMNELENHSIVFQSIHHGHQRPKPVHFVDRNFPPRNLKQHGVSHSLFFTVSHAYKPCQKSKVGQTSIS